MHVFACIIYTHTSNKAKHSEVSSYLETACPNFSSKMSHYQCFNFPLLKKNPVCSIKTFWLKKYTPKNHKQLPQGIVYIQYSVKLHLWGTALIEEFFYLIVNNHTLAIILAPQASNFFYISNQE